MRAPAKSHEAAGGDPARWITLPDHGDVLAQRVEGVAVGRRDLEAAGLLLQLVEPGLQSIW